METRTEYRLLIDTGDAWVQLALVGTTNKAELDATIAAAGPDNFHRYRIMARTITIGDWTDLT